MAVCACAGIIVGIIALPSCRPVSSLILAVAGALGFAAIWLYQRWRLRSAPATA